MSDNICSKILVISNFFLKFKGQSGHAGHPGETGRRGQRGVPGAAGADGHKGRTGIKVSKREDAIKH